MIIACASMTVYVHHLLLVVMAVLVASVVIVVLVLAVVVLYITRRSNSASSGDTHVLCIIPALMNTHGVSVVPAVLGRPLFVVAWCSNAMGWRWDVCIAWQACAWDDAVWCRQRGETLSAIIWAS